MKLYVCLECGVMFFKNGRGSPVVCANKECRKSRNNRAARQRKRPDIKPETPEQRQKRLLRMRRYYQQHKSEAADKARKYRERFPQLLRAQRRKFKENNPTYMREYIRQKRAADVKEEITRALTVINKEKTQ